MDRSFFRFVTMHAFDRQTDGQTNTFLIVSPRWHSIQREKKSVEGNPIWKLPMLCPAKSSPVKITCVIAPPHICPNGAFGIDIDICSCKPRTIAPYADRSLAAVMTY